MGTSVKVFVKEQLYWGIINIPSPEFYMPRNKSLFLLAELVCLVKQYNTRNNVKIIIVNFLHIISALYGQVGSRFLYFILWGIYEQKTGSNLNVQSWGICWINYGMILQQNITQLLKAMIKNYNCWCRKILVYIVQWHRQIIQL